ncbi:hypothetical protein [Faecalispora anaeroviscerum]|uniref:hypothetical protein n=1 Tax=Faecalispora anaeroviscerum TaxID=2991836 RepID=UPI0024BA167C|nr:hypothetical protein [Faecalispora anaeroviscerum]
MKKYYWVFLSLFLYLVCAGIGITVKSTYVDLWAAVHAQPEGEVEHVFRRDQINNPLSLNASAQKILDSAEVVVLARAEQESTYEGKSFLTEMTVQKILKNDGTLNGDRFTVCEPIAIADKQAQGSGIVLYSVHAGSTNGFGIKGAFSRTKIVQGKTYVLFLRHFLPEGWNASPPLYTLIDSPYAKLLPDSTVTAETYQTPVQEDVSLGAWAMPFSESLSYEILLQSKEEQALFFQRKQELLSLLKL